MFAKFVSAAALGVALLPATVALAPSVAVAAPSAPHAAAAPSSQDADFLRAAHQSNLAEIAGGRIAERKGATAVVRALGARFVRDHTALDAAVIKTAAELRIVLPDAPNPEQQELARSYEAAAPAAFDALFVTTQIVAHHKAMELGRTEIAKGSDQRVKQVAVDAAPVIATHHVALAEAKTALGLAYGTNSRRPG